MYCKHCGTKNAENAKFCKVCGASIASVATPSVQPSIQRNKSPQNSGPSGKKSRPILWAGVGGAVVLVLLLLLIFWGSGSDDSTIPTSTSIDTQAQTSLPTVPAQVPSGDPDATNQQSNSNDDTTTPPPIDSGSDTTITADDIAPYLTAVGELWCYQDGTLNDTGSGSVWKFSGSSQSYVLTNDHVIQGDDSCEFLILPTPTDSTEGYYDLDISSPVEWNDTTDAAAVPITSVDSSWATSTPISDLNYSVSTLTECPTAMAQESPVAVLGYPASTQNDGPTMTVTNGVISGYDSSNPDEYEDYYVSAQVDNGNSGGIALSKDSDGLCLLGIPTWISIGENQVEGDVQDINNIFYSGNSQSSQ